ncbi:hypothetical protein Bmul_5131 [Burkholderia multivorans ATCC 17616]|nr:hypothetical protein Bmul_5131 [Burkholderia multivorans ATCC 17616]
MDAAGDFSMGGVNSYSSYLIALIIRNWTKVYWPYWRCCFEFSIKRGAVLASTRPPKYSHKYNTLDHTQSLYHAQIPSDSSTYKIISI